MDEILKLHLEMTPLEGGNGSAVTDTPPTNGDGELGGGGVSGGEMPDSALNGLGDSAPSGGSGLDSTGGATAAPAANDWQSIRDAATALGYQGPQGISDDRSFLQHLIQQANASRQQNFYAQLGQQLAPKAQQIQQYLQTQNQPAQPAAPNPWEAPKFDERWLGLVERDPGTGLFVAKPGGPTEIAQSVNAYAEWKAKYDRDPAGTINGMVEARARAVAQETFQTQFAQVQRQQAIQNIVAQNQTWLYSLDASGNRQADWQGNPIYSPIGTAYIQELQRVQSYGITDPVRQDSLAKELVRGRLAQQGGQQQAAPNPQAQARPNVNPLQGLPPSQRAVTPGATDPAQEGLTLSQQIMRDMRAEGVTDGDIAASIGFDRN